MSYWIYINEAYVGFECETRLGQSPIFKPRAKGDLEELLNKLGLSTRLTEDPYADHGHFIIVDDPSHAALIRLRFAY